MMLVQRKGPTGTIGEGTGRQQTILLYGHRPFRSSARQGAQLQLERPGAPPPQEAQRTLNDSTC